MDFKLHPEWQGIQLLGTYWPMPKPDMDEIEKQTEELCKADLAEEFVGDEFPKFCSPTFLVDKDKNKSEKVSKTRRMVGDYRKLNQRIVPHAVFLPDLEATVEALASCKVKSKLDMRSGFWQVELTMQARDLTAFCIPNGRVFRWKIMLFGLSNAPGIFQELR